MFELKNKLCFNYQNYYFEVFIIIMFIHIVALFFEMKYAIKISFYRQFSGQIFIFINTVFKA